MDISGVRALVQPYARNDGTLWRRVKKKYREMPLSAAGSARKGGRFNPKTMYSLYLAESAHTATLEVGKGIMTVEDIDYLYEMFEYSLTSMAILDLTDQETLQTLGLTTDTIRLCRWLSRAGQSFDISTIGTKPIDPTFQFPLTHRLHIIARLAGADGIRFPSSQHEGGKCLALMEWNQTDRTQATFRDQARLVRDEGFSTHSEHIETSLIEQLNDTYGIIST